MSADVEVLGLLQKHLTSRVEVPAAEHAKHRQPDHGDVDEVLASENKVSLRRRLGFAGNRDLNDRVFLGLGFGRRCKYSMH